MKRRIALMLAVILAAAVLFAGCGDEKRRERTADTANLMSVTLAPTADATDNTLNQVKSTLESRLAQAEVADYSVSVNREKQQITVSYPKEMADRVTVSLLTGQGMLIFRNPNGEPIMDRGYVRYAAAEYDDNKGGYYVLLEFTNEGKELFAEITEEYIGQQISVYIDDSLLSSPTVQVPITDGSAIITGSFTANEAAELAAKINAEPLPFALEIVEG